MGIKLSKNISEQQQSLIQENISLKDKNWFATGGVAKFYCEPVNQDTFSFVLDFASQNKLDIFILGEGANILISDEGFDGLVIKPNIKELSLKILSDDDVEVKAGSGVSFQYLIDWCLNNNVIGLEEFSGIPGTVGGSVFINIHYYEFLLSHFLVEAEIIEKSTGKILKVNNEWFNFGYNSSKLHQKEYFLLSATFKLKKVDALMAAYAKGRSIEIIRHRVNRYPSKKTCGSFFRNFYDSEVKLETEGKKIIYIAYYLDKIGVKGNLRIGDAKVSYQHANMIVNIGNASSNDIISLARKMQELVAANFNIIPQPECQLIGFKEYPLLK